MSRTVSSPDESAARFHAAVPGAHREVTVQDVRDMTELKLIGTYGIYLRKDVETVREILQYEKTRDERILGPDAGEDHDSLYCRRCRGLPRATLRRGSIRLVQVSWDSHLVNSTS